MIARLTALLLTFCIALPMCWCCAAPAHQVAEEAHSCCAMMEPEAASAGCGEHTGQNEPNCPCARHEGNRETVSTSVAVPMPELKLLAPAVWNDLSANFISYATAVPCLALPEHGPPSGTTAPLYERHCAFLL